MNIVLFQKCPKWKKRFFLWRLSSHFILLPEEQSEFHLSNPLHVTRDACAVCPDGVAQACSHMWAREWRQIQCIAEGLLQAVCFPDQILFYHSVGNWFVLLSIFLTLSHSCWGSKDSSHAASMHNTSSVRQPASSYCLQTPALGQVISVPKRAAVSWCPWSASDWDSWTASQVLETTGQTESWFELRNLFSAP